MEENNYIELIALNNRAIDIKTIDGSHFSLDVNQKFFFQKLTFFFRC